MLRHAAESMCRYDNILKEPVNIGHLRHCLPPYCVCTYLVMFLDSWIVAWFRVDGVFYHSIEWIMKLESAVIIVIGNSWHASGWGVYLSKRSQQQTPCAYSHDPIQK